MVQREENNKPMPCTNCITLPICKADILSIAPPKNRIERKIILGDLEDKCSLLRAYVNYSVQAANGVVHLHHDGRTMKVFEYMRGEHAHHPM